MNNQLTDLQNELTKLRALWLEEKDETKRLDYASSGSVIKARIRALEITQKHEKSPYVPFRCPHPFDKIHVYSDEHKKYKTCNECNTFLGEEVKQK